MLSEVRARDLTDPAREVERLRGELEAALTQADGWRSLYAAAMRERDASRKAIAYMLAACCRCPASGAGCELCPAVDVAQEARGAEQ